LGKIGSILSIDRPAPSRGGQWRFDMQIHDEHGFERVLTEADALRRFLEGARDAGVDDADFAASVFADAVAGDADARELVEATAQVIFL
jgi:hypothetical protein